MGILLRDVSDLIHDGLLSMHMTLVLHDGLYYCPTNVYAMDSMPALHYAPAIWRVAGSKHLPGFAPGPQRSCLHECCIPVSKAKQVETQGVASLFGITWCLPA